MDCGTVAKDIYLVETTDTLHSLSPRSAEDFGPPGDDECFDDDAAFRYDSNPSSPADAISTDVLPEAFLNSAIVLEEALSHLEGAIKLFAREANELSSGTCPALDQFVNDVAALRPQVANRVVPEIAMKLADSMVVTPAPVAMATTRASCAESGAGTCVRRDAESRGFRSCRPASLALNLRPDVVPKAALFPDCGVVTGSPRRLRDPLVEMMKRFNKADMACTLAVWGMNRMGPEALGCLRSCLETYGEVEMVTRPRIALATDFALVKMKTTCAVDGIVAAGGRHTVDSIEFVVRRLRDFLVDLDVEHPGQASS